MGPGVLSFPEDFVAFESRRGVGERVPCAPYSSFLPGSFSFLFSRGTVSSQELFQSAATWRIFLSDVTCVFFAHGNSSVKKMWLRLAHP